MSRLEGHTPGPWKADCFLVTAFKNHIGHTGGFLPISRAEEAEANARLIAAAPDLLEVANAASELLALMDEVPNDLPGGESDRVFPHYEFDRLRAALAAIDSTSENATKETPAQKSTRIIVDLRWVNCRLEAKYMSFGVDASGAMAPGEISEWEVVVTTRG